MPTLHVIGSLNHDIIADVARFPAPGETIPGLRLRTSLGGKGANQAVAAARAGGTVSFIGCRGSDAVGKDLAAQIEKNGVDVTNLLPVAAPTGTAIITVDSRGENEIIGIMGANACVAPSQIDDIVLREDDIVLAQIEIPQSATGKAFQKAKACGAKTVLNAAPMMPLLEELRAAMDILIVNENEMAAFCGQTVISTDPDELAARAAKALAPHQSLIVTLGPAGAFFWKDGKGQLFAAPQVKATDTIGAGDCFVGYFCAGLSKGLSEPDAIARANKAASLSVTRAGAADAMPFANEVDGA